MSDLISRQDAINAILSEPTDAHYPTWYAEIIKDLPSAQPERKKGKWMLYDEVGEPNKDDPAYWQCDQCLRTYIRLRKPRNYCPNCGADMRGEPA